MNLFAGLYNFEVLLLLLGVVLFVALLLALLRNVFKDKPYAALLPAFFIPIVMIGYPSIESIQYQNGVVEIQKAADQLQADPSNPQAQAQFQDLEAKVDKIAPRALNDPNASRVLDQARLVLQHPPAKSTNSKTPTKQKTEPATAGDTALTREAEELTSMVAANPQDKENYVRLTEVIEKMKSVGATDPESQAAIARAEKVLGHTVK
jgi:hypothetical protein